MNNQKTMDKLRKNIDSVDNKIIELLEKRMAYVHDIGMLKKENSSPIYRPSREKEILNRLYEKSNRLPNEAIDSIFLEIFSVSRNLEKPEDIAFLGPEGSFTHQATQNIFGLAHNYIPARNIESVFTMVSNKQSKYGVIPIENSSNGIVNNTIESFAKYDNMHIVEEKIIDIHHSLASRCQTYKDIKTIYSKDIAFAQCREFLNTHNLGESDIEWIETDSTSAAAKLSSENENSASICPTVSAKIYKLPILFQSIEDVAHNRTRFFVISDFENKKSGNDKSSVLVNLPNEPGVLFRFLKSFHKANIDLTKIKSHISGGITSFFIEFKGHKNDKKIKKIIQKNKINQSKIKFLGSYEKKYDDI